VEKDEEKEERRRRSAHEAAGVQRVFFTVL